MRRVVVALAAVLGGVALAEDPKKETLPAGATARLGDVGLRHASEVMAVAFSPDGKKLFSWGVEGVMKIWDVEAGRELSKIALRSAQFEQHILFTPDGEALLVNDEEAVRFSITKGAETKRFLIRRGFGGASSTPDGSR